MAQLMKVDKHYISPIDIKLAEFDRNHSLSASQRAEIRKYKEIYRLRNNPITVSKKETIWDSFE